VIVGISGGLDSTHALIVAARAVDVLKLPRPYEFYLGLPRYPLESCLILWGQNQAGLVGLSEKLRRLKDKLLFFQSVENFCSLTGLVRNFCIKNIGHVRLHRP